MSRSVRDEGPPVPSRRRHGRCRLTDTESGTERARAAAYDRARPRRSRRIGDRMQRDLVERARTGDLEAFEELARRSVDRLYVLARLILRDSDRAKDATQEALIAAWRDLAGLRDPD